MSTELGGALGIALLGSVVTLLYRTNVVDALGGKLPPNALRAARDTLGGAIATAADLPDGLGAVVASVARAAFVEAFQASAWTAAAIALLAAVTTALVMGRPRRVAKVAART
jgi:DHA2 family multidrug resistance protein-like MFS transporter